MTDEGDTNTCGLCPLPRSKKRLCSQELTKCNHFKEVLLGVWDEPVKRGEVLSLGELLVQTPEHLFKKKQQPRSISLVERNGVAKNQNSFWLKNQIKTKQYFWTKTRNEDGRGGYYIVMLSSRLFISKNIALKSLEIFHLFKEIPSSYQNNLG